MEEQEKQLEDMSLAELGRVIQAKPEILERVLPEPSTKKVAVAAFQSSI